MHRLIIVFFFVLLSACTSTTKRPEPSTPSTPPPVASKPAPNKCLDCGIVQDIRTFTPNAETAPKRPVLSGIVGGVASKPSSTKPASQYEILIQLLNGKKVVVTQAILSAGLKVGSKVRVSQGRILAVAP
jgi:hypothetical protein